MNKNIKLAVAGAVLALSASANAGIIIPAGDWTVDIGGNVNTFTTWTKAKVAGEVLGGVAGAGDAGATATTNNFTTGLLPHFLSVSGSTRQNDLDVAFTISIQPGTSNKAAFGNDSGQNNRQAFVTFGDKSWGSVKVGKDLGLFASDAILSDMTLLGVGSAAGTAGGNTTLGRIGTGYIYADWKPQITYTTPNFNGFQATAGISQGWTLQEIGVTDGTDMSGTKRAGASPAYEGKASYAFNANGVDGKVWVSGIAQKIIMTTKTLEDSVAYAGDIGATVNAGGFGLTGYYYAGTAIGTTGQFMGGVEATTGNSRESDGGYVQATYALPTKTKVGISWGQSNLDRATGEGASSKIKSNEMWTGGIYHPITKHLNLVAEYSRVQSESHLGVENKNNIGSLGAILFF
jgi:predicted porin